MPSPRSPCPEQLGFAGMPERLFVCTPSKLGAYADCPRRYRYSYVDRPAPPKGPPWAHNSLGASVHTALRNWYALPADRRAPEALPALLKATWVREGYRDDEQERAAYRRALGWLEAYVDDARPGRRAARRRAGGGGQDRGAGLQRPRRPDRLPARADGPRLVIVDYKTGRTGLDADDARGSQALALYAYAAERVFRRPCRRVELHHLPTGTVAAHEHTEESLARQCAGPRTPPATSWPPRRRWPPAPIRTRRSPPRRARCCGWCDFRRGCPAGPQAPAEGAVGGGGTPAESTPVT